MKNRLFFGILLLAIQSSQVWAQEEEAEAIDENMETFSLRKETCSEHEVKTGGDLNGKTKLQVCHNGFYVRNVQGYHQNNGVHTHWGRIRIADNKGKAWDENESFPWRPDENLGNVYTVGYDVPRNWRICAVFVKSSGTFTNHACMKMTKDGVLYND